MNFAEFFKRWVKVFFKSRGEVADPNFFALTPHQPTDFQQSRIITPSNVLTFAVKA